jgi:hypothetical protein
MVSRVYLVTIRFSLYIASRSFNVSFSSMLREIRVVLSGLTSLRVGISSHIGIVGSALSSGFIYFQVSPPLAIVFITNSHGS